MSVKVDLGALAEEIRKRDFAYLLTVGDDQRPHAVATRPVPSGGRLLLEALGRRTSANLRARPAVTLVWPPLGADGYSLIVDAHAESDGESVVARPEHAVLHRPAADGGHDCQPVGQSETG